MKKVDLFSQYYQADELDDTIRECWVEWIYAQKKPTNPDLTYYDVYKMLPKHYNWYPSLDGHIHFSWNEGKVKIPLETICDDLDDQPNLEMIWHSDYYDRPLRGMAKYNDEWVWFELDDYDNRNWMYSLYKLSPEEIKTELYHHNLFRTMVGIGSDHHPTIFEPIDKSLITDTTAKEFYNMSKTWPKTDYTKNEKVGTFAYHQFRWYSRNIEKN